MHSNKILCISFLLLLCFLLANIRTSGAQQCVPSSCGNLPNISYPFRLKTDPRNCGERDYELGCQNNQTIVTFKSKKFHVKSITYENFTIRAVDPNVDNNDPCSAPTNSSILLFEDVYSLPYNGFDYNIPIVYIRCQKPVKNSRYVENTLCRGNGTRNSAFSNSSSGEYSYIAVGNRLRISDLEESCGVEMNTQVSRFGPLEGDVSSLAGVHGLLAYGFELSWYQVFCKECASTLGTCIFENNEVTCRHYCYEGGPGFRCQLEFWGLIVGFYSLIGVGALLGLRFVIGIICLTVLVVFKWRRRHFSADETVEEFLQHQSSLMPIKYSYSEIKRMTKNFTEKLGEGGCGSVYKGKLRSGPFVAVKIMENTTISEREFVSEVATIGRIHHVNVVQLVGFCTEGSKRALIYEFIPNGSLDKYIFPKGQSISVSLSYDKVFDIALGVARGIDYLHRDSNMRILHFDIKPHNILLDENCKPKISDFGLSLLYPANQSFVSLLAARGTMGYMAPEMLYKNIGGVSYKADVYSFGMLLMEMARRRENRNPRAEHVSQNYFPCWAYDQFHAGKDIDMAFVNADERKMVKKMILVASWCIQMKPADRPAMDKIVEMLERDADLIRMPPKPFLAPREMAQKFETNTSSVGSSLVISIESRDSSTDDHL